MSLRLPPDEYAAVCRTVLDRDGWKCRVCGYRQNLNVHHIVFRSEQGVDESWNLLTICNMCHDAVHAYKLYILLDEGNIAEAGGGADGKLIYSRRKW